MNRKKKTEATEQDEDSEETVKYGMLCQQMRDLTRRLSTSGHIRRRRTMTVVVKFRHRRAFRTRAFMASGQRPDTPTFDFDGRSNYFRALTPPCSPPPPPSAQPSSSLGLSAALADAIQTQISASSDGRGGWQRKVREGGAAVRHRRVWQFRRDAATCLRGTSPVLSFPAYRFEPYHFHM